MIVTVDIGSWLQMAFSAVCVQITVDACGVLVIVVVETRR